MKPRIKGHRGHAYCGRLCLPSFLYDEFQSILGPRSAEFDVLTWCVKQDKEFAQSYGIISEPITAWREAFKIELAMKGWAPAPKHITARVGALPNPITALHKQYITPCPHPNPCVNTRACCVRQDVERIAGIPANRYTEPDEKPEEWWQR